MALRLDASRPLGAGGQTQAGRSVAGDGTGTAAGPARPTIQAAQPTPVDRSALAQGGDPWVPPAARVRPSASSPHGAALAARVQAKIAERDRDVYR